MSCRGENGGDGTNYEGHRSQQHGYGVGVGRGVYYNFLLLERHNRMENECLYRDGLCHKVSQSMGVPSCVFRGGVLHLEHGKDAVPGERPVGEGVGRGEPHVRLLDRPNAGGILESSRL